MRNCAVPRSLRPRSVLLACVLVAAAARFTVPVADPDFWYHLATGRWMLEHGRLPAHDLYTFTVAGHPWVDYEWLTEVVTWVMYGHAGMAAVSVCFGVVTWIGFLFLYLSVTADRPPYLIAAGALALALVMTGAVWGPRPQMVTFTLASVELYLLRRLLSGAGRDRAVYLIPPLIALWANLHGGWPLGWLLIGVAAMAEGMSRLGGHDRPRSAANLRTLTLIAVPSAVAPLLNPNGVAVYAAPLVPITSHAQQALINEWQSPNFHDPWTWPLGLAILLLIAGAAAARPRLFDLLLTCCCLAMALISVRHVALFALAAAPMLTHTWGAAFTGIEPRLPGFLTRQRPARLWAALVVFALTCAATAGATAWRLGQQGAVTRSLQPVGAAGWLAAHPGVGTRMFNDYPWGGYLAYRFFPSPTRRVYIYTEANVMGDALLWRYETVQDLRPGWRQVLDEDRVDYIVTASAGPLAGVLATQPGWHLAYRDSTATIFVRR
jgi:hypothetical protein